MLVSLVASSTSDSPASLKVFLSNSLSLSLYLTEWVWLNKLISYKEWNETYKWKYETEHHFFFFVFNLCGTMSVWESDWLTLTFFFFFPVFVFLNLAVLCSLHLTRSHAHIYIYIYLLGPVVQPQQCLCLCVISVFVFGGSVGVFVCWVGLVGRCVSVLCVHILPKFQFWNWNLEKNNLKKFWKSYNINNIGFFLFFFKGLHHPTFID